MKTLIYLLSLALLICSCDDDEAANTFEGDVVLFTQEEVVAFGKKGYRNINGRLFIGDGCAEGSGCGNRSEIYDLTPLATIKTVKGRLRISASSVTSLDGLENLIQVGGISIGLTPITSLSAFSQIDSTGNIFFTHIDIQDLYGFHNLKYVKERLNIHSCEKLQSLNELKNLNHVGDLYLHNLHGLTNLEGLENITTINGYVDIFNNHNLTSLSGLQNLKHVGEELKIVGNDKASFAALAKLDTVGQLVLTSGELQNLDGLQNLRYVREKISISGDNIQNLAELSNLQQLGSLEIYRCGNLVSLSGLENVMHKPASVAIFKNPGLKNLCGIVPMIKDGFNGKFSVYENSFNPTVEDLVNGNCSN